MCGIFAYFGYKDDHRLKSTYPNMIAHRGPDTTNTQTGNLYATRHCSSVPYQLVFHRLAINGLGQTGEQPLSIPSAPHLKLLCNGEIYNYEELIERYHLAADYSKGGSDCEIILHMYMQFGFFETVRQLSGDFAIVLIDTQKNRIYAARDPHGVRGMYFGWSREDGLAFSSELKALHGIFWHPGMFVTPVDQFPAGAYVEIDANRLVIGDMDVESAILDFQQYYNYAHQLSISMSDETTICQRLRELLTASVKRRLICERRTDAGVPAIGAYLSGGFDSSVVASLVQSFYPGRLKTYSIGFQDSPDLLAARKVAAMIGSEHHEYVVTEEQALRMLPDVIRQVETMDVTTIRASTFMLMLSYYIRDNSDIAVVFSGEGSDEMGSYAYFKRAPDEASFQQEACRLLQELPFYDAQRADRCSAAAGLELRVPFLDKELVQYYMQIPPALRTQRGFEKYLLRKACSDLYGPALLPEEILWRPKEAMSDGVSQLGRSWSTIIQENIMSQRYVGDGVAGFRSIALPGPMESPVMAERSAFRDMFLQYYPGCQHLLRHYWLPSWCGDVQDPSARVLEVYDRKAALM